MLLLTAYRLRDAVKPCKSLPRIETTLKKYVSMFIYVMTTDDFAIREGHSWRKVTASKIGFASDVQRRLMELQVGSPLPLRIFKTLEVPGKETAFLIENQCHTDLKQHHIHGEWFNITAEKAWECIHRNFMRKRSFASLRKPKFEIGSPRCAIGQAA